MADEAAKLFGALSDWARTRARLGTGSRPGRTRRPDANEHIATGGAECTYCPICRTVHVVRQASPEVRSHLAVAAASLMQAAAGPARDRRTRRARAGAARGDGVEHIDLDDEPWPEEETE